MENVVSKVKPVVFENPQEELYTMEMSFLNSRPVFLGNPQKCEKLAHYKMENAVSKVEPVAFENPQEELHKMENVLSKL